MRKSNAGFDVLEQPAPHRIDSPHPMAGTKTERVSFWNVFVAVWIVTCCGFDSLGSLETSLFAQAGNEKAGAETKPAKGLPAANGPAPKIGAPETKANTGTKSKKAAGNSRETAAPAASPATAAPANQLAPGFVPPRKINPQMLIDKPLPVVPDWNKKQTNFRRILADGIVQNEVDRKLLRLGIQDGLAKLTLKENRENLLKVRTKLMSFLRNQKPNTPMTARDEFLTILTEESEKLLDNHFVVRLNVVLMLAELNSREVDTKNGQREVPCFLAATALLRVLSDKDQLEGVKIPAIKGVARIAVDPAVRADLKYRIISTLLEELQNSKSLSFWYQWRLAEGLGQIGVTDDVNKRPVVVQVLAKVMGDKDRHWLVRSEAAHSIGRLPLEGVQVDPLAFEMVRLAQDMGRAYEKDPKEAYWSDCFFRLYLAFKPLNAEEKQKKFGLLEQVQKGSLAQYRKYAEEAYQQILPLVQSVLKAKASARLSEQLKVVMQWLESNPPKESRIAPSEESIITKQPTTTATSG